MKGLIQDLYRHLITNKVDTRNNLRSIGMELGYDYSTVDRKLRKLTELGFIKPLKGSKNFNDRYILIEPKNTTTAHFEPKKDTPEERKESLNDRLKEVLKKLPKQWESFEDIKSVQLAIKSKNEYLKNCVLEQYEDKI